MANVITAPVVQHGGDVQTYVRVRRQRKRRAEVELTDDMAVRVRRNVAITMTAQHRDSTLQNYKGYIPPIDNWYHKNCPQLCTDGILDHEKFRASITTEEDLETACQTFKVFLDMRKHCSLVNRHTGEPMRALAGTLRSYRSAFAWYIWTKHGKSIPFRWQQNLKGFFKGVSSQEAELRQTGQLPMTEGQTQLTKPLYRWAMLQLVRR